MTSSKKKRTRRGARAGRKRGRKRGQKKALPPPNWQLRMEELRRKAVDRSPDRVSVQLWGWELQLAWKPGDDEAWSLLARPVGEAQNWPWIMKVADYLKIPQEAADGTPQRLTREQWLEAGLSMIVWTWKPPPDPADTLPGGLKPKRS